mgnify:CR=1 FL=1
MCKTELINVCNKTAENETDTIEVDTDVYGNNKSRLIPLLENSKIHSLRVFYVLA